MLLTNEPSITDIHNPLLWSDGFARATHRTQEDSLLMSAGLFQKDMIKDTDEHPMEETQGQVKETSISSGPTQGDAENGL